MLKSNDKAELRQPSCLGVYRMVGLWNAKPVYKQDNDEHYLYFNSKEQCWMVGSRWGHNYGWLKNMSKGQEKTPLLELKHGWAYAPLAQEEHVKATWERDDLNLTVEPLGG